VRFFALCLAGGLLSAPSFAADQVQAATLKDLQTVGTTSKKQKHQQYDLVIDTSSNEYTCRTKLGGSFNPTQFVVGSPLQFKVNGQKGEAKTADGKKTNCAVVRVASAGGF
jgi:3-keto-L-gulonate-6-phosphate decarboxylase